MSARRGVPDTRISLEEAQQLVWMGSHVRAASQLEGAVALHNILERERVAYLADEVGLGKTYVALATMALYRHRNPDFRVLVIAPKANIQEKWVRDWQAFTRHNWRIPDLRVRGAAGGPARQQVLPDRLSDLVYETQVDDDRDMFARLTSFSFAVHGDRAKVVSALRRALPWIDPSDVPTRQDALRDFVAQAYNAALSPYDLVVIDEAHNLKHGVWLKDGRIAPNVSIRNAVLSQMLGKQAVTPAELFAETYRPIAKRVLMLSATPIETSFESLWKQLDLVDKAEPEGRPSFAPLTGEDEAEAQAAARRIMIRRINELTVNGSVLTKNMYRRVWTQGGVQEFDNPLRQGTTRQRLTVALVQKQVSDVVGARFGSAFQMGMLASFESFEQTARARATLASAEPTETSDDLDPSAPQGNFDGADQADNDDEREGADASLINALAESHVATFGCEMAHPKMDALVEDLSHSWEDGSKALVFVRRIASVGELKRKLDERYDAWLFGRLRRDLPAEVWNGIEALRPAYEEERAATGRRRTDPTDERRANPDTDSGGSDTFFSWFFRGEGPEALRTSRAWLSSGAYVATRLNDRAGAFSTVFAQHLVSMVLGVAPGECLDRLTVLLGTDRDSLISMIEERARQYLPPSSAGRRQRFEAVQQAALELLDHGPEGPERTRARALFEALGPVPTPRSATVRLDVAVELGTETFFTRLREHPAVEAALTPGDPDDLAHEPTPGERLRATYLCHALIAGAARLGHSLIDLYVCVMHVTGGAVPDDVAAMDATVTRFLALLESQRRSGDRSGAFHELQQISANFDLIRRQNLPETEQEGFTLGEAAREIGLMLGSQQPVVGLARRVNRRALRQFRMPGYPLALICTEVLQEGEDLHTFCRRVVHYGVGWTPSSMEQRNGRVDRLYSMAERRFRELDRGRCDPQPEELIQVQIPYVSDTVEVLQVRRVLEGMFRFTTLMHESEERPEKRIQLDEEFTKPVWVAPRVDGRLRTTFEVRTDDLLGPPPSSVEPDPALGYWLRLRAAVLAAGPALDLADEPVISEEARAVYASRRIGSRVQPFTLRLSSRGALPLVRGLSPVGRVAQQIADGLAGPLVGVRNRVTTRFDQRDREYDVAVEGDVILGDPAVDEARIAALVIQLTEDADYAERVLTSTDLTLADVRRTLEGDLNP